MAELRFRNAGLSGLVTTVGGRALAFDAEAADLGMAPDEAERLKRAMGFTTRHVVVRDDTTTADLCRHFARHLLDAFARLVKGAYLAAAAVNIIANATD